MCLLNSFDINATFPACVETEKAIIKLINHNDLYCSLEL